MWNRRQFKGALPALPFALQARLPLFTLLLAVLAYSQGVFEKRASPVNPAETQNFKRQTKVALIVGVSKYPEASGFSELHFAASDAEEVGAALKAQGYLVNVLTNGNATRAAPLCECCGS